MRLEQTGAYLDLVDIAARAVPLWEWEDEEPLSDVLRYGSNWSFEDPNVTAQIKTIQRDFASRSAELWRLMGWKTKDDDLIEDSREDDRWCRAVGDIVETARRKRKPSATSSASSFRSWQQWKVTHQRANDRGELRGLTGTAEAILLAIYDFCRPTQTNGYTLSGWSTQRILVARAHTNYSRVGEWLQRLHDGGFIALDRGKPGRPAKDGGGGQPMRFQLLSPVGNGTLKERRGNPSWRPENTPTIVQENTPTIGTQKPPTIAPENLPGGSREEIPKGISEESAHFAHGSALAAPADALVRYEGGEKKDLTPNSAEPPSSDYQSEPQPTGTGTRSPDALPIWSVDAETDCRTHGQMYCGSCHVIGWENAA